MLRREEDENEIMPNIERSFIPVPAMFQAPLVYLTHTARRRDCHLLQMILTMKSYRLAVSSRISHAIRGGQAGMTGRETSFTDVSGKTCQRM